MADAQLLVRLDALGGLLAAGPVLGGFALMLFDLVLSVFALTTVAVGGLIAVRSYRRGDAGPTATTADATNEPRV